MNRVVTLLLNLLISTPVWSQSILWRAPHFGQNDLLDQRHAIHLEHTDVVRGGQVAGHPELFVGRETCLWPALPGVAEDATYCLVLKQADWSSSPPGFIKIATLLDTNSTPCGLTLGDSNVIGGRVYDNSGPNGGCPHARYDASSNHTFLAGGYGNNLGAYDPDILLFNNEYWIAFECNHVGIDWEGTRQFYNPSLTSTCMAPITGMTGDFSSAKVDVSRAYVAIFGLSNIPGHSPLNAAAVPKLLLHQGAPYLYWTAVEQKEDHTFLNLTTRGVRLGIDPLYHLLMPVLSNGRVGPAYSDSVDTVTVWGTDGATITADVASLRSDGNYVYAVASLGNAADTGSPACLQPNEVNSVGCYRLGIARSQQPLGHRAFNSNWLPVTQLPGNPFNYGSFVHWPDGTLAFMGFFYSSEGRRTYGNDLPLPSVSGAPAIHPVAFPLVEIGDWTVLEEFQADKPLSLAEGQYKEWGYRRLVMQADGNLVLYDTRSWRALWSVYGDEQVSFAPDCARYVCSATFSSTGRLTLKMDANEYFSSNSYSHNAKLTVNDSYPYLIVWDEVGKPVFQAHLSASKLSGKTFKTGTILTPNQTVATSTVSMTLQTDGNLVFKDRSGSVLWSIFGSEKVDFVPYCVASKCALGLKTNGELALTNNGIAYWSSRTAGAGLRVTLDSYTRGLFISDPSTGQVLWGFPSWR